MNMWFYDFSMPEFALHNHEKLCHAGETPREALGIAWGHVAAGILPVFLVSAFTLWFLAGTMDDTSNYVESGSIFHDLYNYGRTAKVAAKKDLLGSNYTNVEGQITMDYNSKNGGQELKFFNSAKNAKTYSDESRSWWDRVNTEADKAARAMIASGKVGHHH